MKDKQIEKFVRAASVRTIRMVLDHWFNEYSKMVPVKYHNPKHTIDYFWP